jgi:tetratricopeptide (TPR) repeat protein
MVDSFQKAVKTASKSTGELNVRATVQVQSFGPFSLDPATARLLRDGTPLELRPQAFHALYALAKNSGKFVGYEQMIREAWGGTLVSKHTVAVTVGEVKRTLGEFGRWIGYRANLGYCLNVPRSDKAIRKGLHFSNRQTREGLEKARATFAAAAEADPSDSRAWEGLAQACLALGTYGMTPPHAAYASALHAIQKAADLEGWTPELQADRAHGLIVFERKFGAAESILLDVLKERPKLGTTYVRLSMLYATSGRPDLAMEIAEQGHQADPLLCTLPGAELFIHLCRSDIDAAIREGQDATELHPFVPLARALFASALGMAGRWPEAIEQIQIARKFSSDVVWLVALEGACMAGAGRKQEALALAEEVERLRKTDYVDAYFVALLYDALKDRTRAFAELERALKENSATLFLLNVDPRFQCLRGDVRFTAIRDRVFSESLQNAAG